MQDVVEPAMAEMVRPIADKILTNQETHNLQEYNSRFNSLNQVKDSMEKLQHRNDADLPPLPDRLIRGKPNAVINPVVIQPIEILGPSEKELINIELDKFTARTGIATKLNQEVALNKAGLDAAIAEWRAQQKRT